MTLDRWLEIATHGLAPAPAERVRQEYAAAFADAQEAGEWPYDVLAGWGDPHRVNRELRRVHLTTREARALHPGYAPTLAGVGRALQEDAGFAVAFVVFGFLSGGTVTADRWAMSAALLLSSCLRWLVVSRLSERVPWRAAASWFLHRGTVFGAALLWLVWESGVTRRAPLAELVGQDLVYGALLLAYAAYLLHRLLTSLHAAHKLQGEAA